MFKTLIKKVREEGTNVSILPENNSSDEINGHSNKDQIDEDALPTRVHRKLLEKVSGCSIDGLF